MVVRQGVVIHAELVQDGREQIGDADRIVGRPVTDFVCRAVDVPLPEAPAGQ